MKLRLPYEGDALEISEACASVMPTGAEAVREDRTRQELKAETDLNVLLKRYSPFDLPAREAFAGERFYDRDFHEDMLAARRAFEVYASNEAARSAMSFEDFLRQVPDDGLPQSGEPTAGTNQPSEGEGGSVQPASQAGSGSAAAAAGGAA